MPKPNCHRCRHFGVTWVEAMPYECRAFGFRSSRLPSIVVRQNSGEDCKLCEPKAETRDA